jgi:hypothetical protein
MDKSRKQGWNNVLKYVNIVFYPSRVFGIFPYDAQLRFSLKWFVYSVIFTSLLVILLVYSYMYDMDMDEDIHEYLGVVTTFFYAVSVVLMFAEGLKKGLNGVMKRLRGIDRILGDRGMTFQGDIRKRALMFCAAILAVSSLVPLMCGFDDCDLAEYANFANFVLEWTLVECTTRQISGLLHLLDARFDFALGRLALVSRLPRRYQLQEYIQLCTVHHGLIKTSEQINRLYSPRVLQMITINFYFVTTGSYYVCRYGLYSLFIFAPLKGITYMVAMLAWAFTFIYQLLHLISAFSKTTKKAWQLLLQKFKMFQLLIQLLL